ncbi:MAG: tetratricopeptide repeat protein [Candidatus Hodarchaeota archaeon]
MMLKKKITQIIADSYHASALANCPMRNVTESLEIIRTAMLEKKDLFQAWHIVDIQIGKAEDDSLLQVLTKLRDRYEQEVHNIEIVRLYKVFKKNPESGWMPWLRTYSKALSNWKLNLAYALVGESFPFPSNNDQMVKKIRQSTRHILHERWPETYDLFLYLAEQKILSKILRAKMYVIAGEIQLYQLMNPNKAKELFQRADKLAQSEGRVSCGWGEYWLQKNEIDKAKGYFKRAIKIAPLLADGYTKMGECYEREGDLHAAEEWCKEAVTTAGGGYYRLLQLYEWPELFEENKKRIQYHVKRAIALDPEGMYTIYIYVGNIYKRNNEYEEALRWYQKAIRLDRTRLTGYISKGYIYLDSKIMNYNKSRANFLKAIKIAPEAFDGYWGLSWLYEKQEDWENAIKWYKESLLRRPEWEGRILAKIGEINWKLERYSEAEMELIKALHVDPDNELASSILLNRADDYYLKLEDPSSALQLYNKIRQIKGESYEAEYQNRVGNVNYYFGQNKDAVDAYQKAIIADPKMAVYHSNLGGAYRDLGEYKKAEEAYKKAIKLEPDNANYLNKLGKVFYRNGDYEKAIDWYKAAINIDSRKAVFHANLGLAFRDLGKWNDAKKAYNKAMKLDPDNADYHNAIGIVYYWSGDVEKSIPYYRKAIKLAPSMAVFRANLGLAFRDLGRLEEAKKAYLKATEFDLSNAGYQSDLGNIFFRLGNYENAINCVKKAIKLAPNAAVYHANLGFALGSLEKWDEAKEAYSKAIKLDPNNTEYLNALGLIYYKSRDFEKSIPYYSKAIKLDPNVAMFYQNLGLSFEGLKKWSEAKKAYLKAVELEPDNAVFLNLLGIVFYRSGNSEQAVNWYKKAIEKDPRMAIFRSNLILAYNEIGKQEEAKKAYLEATKFDPKDADYQNELGNAFYANSDYSNAVKQYLKAIKIDPKNEDYLSNFIGACEQLESLDNAISSLKSVAKLVPNNVKVTQAIGKLNDTINS